LLIFQGAEVMRAGVGFRGVAGVKSLQSDVMRRRRLMQDNSLYAGDRPAAMIEAANMLDDIDTSMPSKIAAGRG